MRITIDGERSETSIKRSIEPNRWHMSKGSARALSKFEKDLNQYLKHISHQVYLKQQELEEKNKIVSARTLMNLYLNKGDDKKTILKVYEEHNNKLKLLIGKGVAFNTYKRHKTSKRHLEKFLKEKYKMRDYYLTDIDPEFVEKYETYFRIDRGCNNNTTVKYVRNFAKIIRIAQNKEWISSNPLRNLQLKIEEVDKPFLNDVELNAVVNKKMQIERIAQVRDVFVFCCYTGLAFVDVLSLTLNDIDSTNDGTLWIRKRRNKTKQWAHIPILPIAKRILDKYKSHPVCLDKGVLLPVLSNQKMNAYLKEVADLCGITKNLTTHCARHTFATTVTLANNISMESVSKMLGHSSLNITKRYARIIDKTIAGEMEQLAKKLEIYKNNNAESDD